MIRFKVEEETFKEATPAPPKVVGSGETEQHRNEEHKEPVYSLIVILILIALNAGELSRGWAGSSSVVGGLNVQNALIYLDICGISVHTYYLLRYFTRDSETIIPSRLRGFSRIEKTSNSSRPVPTLTRYLRHQFHRVADHRIPHR